MPLSRRFRSLAALLLSLTLSLSAGAVLAEEAKERIRSVLAERAPMLTITDIRETEMQGIYEVRTNSRTLHMTADAQYAFLGSMLRFDEDGGVTNVTERRLDGERKKALKQIEPDDMITFSPSSEVKAKLYVFTDINCGYCRKFHRNMDAMTELGIEVNYLAFPRGGPGTEGYRKAVDAWCSENPKEALTRAKQGEAIPDRECDHPVDEQYRLGRTLGVSGTPALLLETGRLVRGFKPPHALADILNLDS